MSLWKFRNFKFGLLFYWVLFSALLVGNLWLFIGKIGQNCGQWAQATEWRRWRSRSTTILDVLQGETEDLRLSDFHSFFSLWVRCMDRFVSFIISVCRRGGTLSAFISSSGRILVHFRLRHFPSKWGLRGEILIWLLIGRWTAFLSPQIEWKVLGIERFNIHPIDRFDDFLPKLFTSMEPLFLIFLQTKDHPFYFF
jgi:hypothetical protein